MISCCGAATANPGKRGVSRWVLIVSRRGRSRPVAVNRFQNVRKQFQNVCMICWCGACRSLLCSFGRFSKNRRSGRSRSIAAYHLNHSPFSPAFCVAHRTASKQTTQPAQCRSAEPCPAGCCPQKKNIEQQRQHLLSRQSWPYHISGPGVTGS